MKAVIGRSIAPQICFVGPYGVGKTTAVRTISARPVLETEAASSAAHLGRHLKRSTTVGLEYGDWSPVAGQTIAIVGTPGQARFDAVRQGAMKRSNGVVLWLFADHKHGLQDAQLWIEFLISEGVNPEHLSIAITRLAEPAQLSEFTQAAAGAAGMPLPVLAADPRDVGDVEAVLRESFQRLKLPVATAVMNRAATRKNLARTLGGSVSGVTQ